MEVEEQKYIYAQRQDIFPEVKTYFDEVVMTTCRQFFLGLLEPRGTHNFFDVSNDNIRKGIIRPPYFSDVMADYVLTQILPLEYIVKSEKLKDGFLVQRMEDEEAITHIMNTFTDSLAVLKAVYLEVWPKHHPLMYKRITKRGNEIFDIHLMQRSAAEKIYNAMLKLTNYFYYQFRPSRSIDDIPGDIVQLGKLNKFDVSKGEGLSEDKSKLVNALMWFVTGFTDWLEIEAGYPADIVAAARMIMPFKSDEEINYFCNPEKPNRKVQTEEQYRNMQELEDRIYKIFIAQNIYPSDQALFMALGLIISVVQDEEWNKISRYIDYFI